MKEALRVARNRQARKGSVRVAGVELSTGAGEALDRVLEEFSKGNAVVVEGSRGVSEYTTTQAAAELGMSRPTLIDLLDRGELSYRMVGTHRRIPRADVERYGQSMHRGGDAASRRDRVAALREMAKTTADAGEGY
ncbi:MAG: helix-turn-helix domain-containing protein [Gemmatimonadota bacterium]